MHKTEALEILIKLDEIKKNLLYADEVLVGRDSHPFVSDRAFETPIRCHTATIISIMKAQANQLEDELTSYLTHVEGWGQKELEERKAQLIEDLAILREEFNDWEETE